MRAGGGPSGGLGASGGLGEALPRGLKPMLATAGTLPRDADAWSYEVKWDGVRALVAVENGSLTLTSRNGNDLSAAYPELVGLATDLAGRSVLLDAEVVAFDDEGRTDFGRLQGRMHVRRPGAALVTSTPVQLLVFDLLHLDGTSLLCAPYDERRAALDALGIEGKHWSVPPSFLEGQDLLDVTKAQGLEGVIAKRRDAAYTPGRRSDCWLKLKHIRRTSALVAGWKPGEGGRSGRIGSLLLGQHGPAGLEYAGHVGTGFTTATLTMLTERLAPLRRADSPFAAPIPRMYAKDAVWVEPVLVAEVDYSEWTRDGRLRHPSYKGLRDDVQAAAVVRE